MKLMRLSTWPCRFGVVAALLLCATRLAAQAAERQRSDTRVLLVPRVWDALSEQLMDSLLATARHNRSPFSFVSRKDLATTFMQGRTYQEEVASMPLRETCKLVSAARYVAISRSGGTADSLRLVISGAACAAPVDSVTFAPTLSPRNVLMVLAAHLSRGTR
jgi:hypothetical protein